MDDNMKIVDFGRYCPLCKYEKTDQTEDPCDECLGSPARQYSSKPVNFKNKF